MRIALDTNSYSALEIGKAPLLKKIVGEADLIVIPFIVDAELKAGFTKGQKKDINYKKLKQFLAADRAIVIWADEDTDEFYAKIWAELASKGTLIPTNDVWIAALCLQHHLTLATSDRHFRHVPLLQTIPSDK